MRHQGRPAATTPEQVRRLSAAVDGASRGESLLLCADVGAPSQAATEATACLSTLAAFTLAYASGRPVSTVLMAPDPAPPLGWHPGDHAALTGGPIGKAAGWRVRLAPGTWFDAAEEEFLKRLTKAWGFATAYGAQADAVARALAADRFLAMRVPARAHPMLVRQNPETGHRYGLVSPGLLYRPGERRQHAAQVARLRNPVVLRLRPGTAPAELATLCARLNPAKETGRLVVLTPPTPDRRLAGYLTATAAHRPAWVLDCGTGDTGTTGPRPAERLRRMTAVLHAHGAHLGGLSLAGRGRRLERVVRLATVLAGMSEVRIIDHTLAGAAG